MLLVFFLLGLSIGTCLIARLINLYALTFLPVAASLLAYRIFFGQSPADLVQIQLASWATLSWLMYLIVYWSAAKLKLPRLKGVNPQLNVTHQLYLLFFVAGIVAYIFAASVGGVTAYFAEAMEIRTAVADGRGVGPVEAGRPAVLHTISLGLLLFLTVHLASRISMGVNSGLPQLTFHVTFLVLAAVLISLSDISRGRLLDVFLLIIFGFLLAYGPKPVNRQFSIWLKWGGAAATLIIVATVLQGKSAIWDGPIYGALGSLLTYLALPVYYFEEFTFGSYSSEPHSVFVGVISILQKLGFCEDLTLNNDRGLSLGGTDAILIFPMIKWWISDFGITAGILISSAHLAVAGFLDARVTRRFNIGQQRVSEIWMLAAISGVWSVMTYKPLTVYYLLAFLILIGSKTISALKFTRATVVDG